MLIFTLNVIKNIFSFNFKKEFKDNKLYNNKKQMQSHKLDIVELIEVNPIIRLSKHYQGKFLEKIQNTFNETEQRLFVSS